MSTPRMTRAEQREQTRVQLLAAAARTVARSGYHAASLDAVAADAGVTKGAVYHNFPSKEALLLALLRSHTEQDWISEGLKRTEQDEVVLDEEFLLLMVELWAYAVRTGRGREEVAQSLAAARLSIRRALAARHVDVDEEEAAMVLAADLGLALQMTLAPDLLSSTTFRRMLDRLVRGD